MPAEPFEAAFEELTRSCGPELRGYCRKIAGTEWDGDDLYQETLLKAFRRFRRWPERELSKAYLYRIAANAWFDICRRRKIAFMPEFLTDQTAIAYAEWSPYDVRESLETLMDALEPRQVALILLTDVFGFAPSETATALGQPATAVKAALHRARKRLKKAADKHLHAWEETEDDTDAAQASGADAELLDAFVQAFRRADALAMIRSYRALSDRGVKIESAKFVGGRAWFTFKDPDGNVLTIASSSPFAR